MDAIPQAGLALRTPIHDLETVRNHIREGRFQRSLSLLTLGLLSEILPWPENRVTLDEEKDRFGLPIVHVSFNLHENGHRLIKAATAKTVKVMQAAEAEEVVHETRYAHLVGAARMGSDPRSSVVDKFGRSHDIPNLFICDGSIMPTQDSANPGLTIQALAARTADYLISQGDAVFSSNRRGITSPQFAEISLRPQAGAKLFPDSLSILTTGNLN